MTTLQTPSENKNKNTYVGRLYHRIDSEHRSLGQAPRTWQFQSCFIIKTQQHLYQLTDGLLPIAQNQLPIARIKQLAAFSQQPTANSHHQVVTNQWQTPTGKH